MADTNLRLVITAKDEASGDLKKVAGNLDDVGDKANQAQAKTESFANRALKGVLVGASVAAVAALGSLAASAVGAAAGFEQGLSNIKAVSGATADEMKSISGLALQLGKDTSFSASAAAAGIEELIKGGVSIADVMGGAAQSTLELAAAGGVDLASAAEIAANALAIFNLKGEDMAMVSNQIAGAANASSLSVTDFQYSMAAAGTVMDGAGQEFDDLATSIAVLGANGLKGSDAGTSLKTMFMNLQPTTVKQSAAFRELNLLAEDGTNKFINLDGSFKSAAEIAGILQEATKGLTDSQRTLTLETMFGSDAVRAASIFVKAGAEGFDQMAESMGKVTAASVAADRLDNLRGDWEQLTGSLETAGIVGTTVLIPMLRDLVQWGTKTVNAAIPLLEAYGPDVADAVGDTAHVLGSVLLPALNGVAAATIAWELGSLPAQITAVTAATKAWALALSPVALLAVAVAVAVGLATIAHQRFEKAIDETTQKALDLDPTLRANVASMEAFAASQAAQGANGKILIENLTDLEEQYRAVQREIVETTKTAEAHAGRKGTDPAAELAAVEPRLAAMRDLQGELADRIATTRNAMSGLTAATGDYDKALSDTAIEDRAAAYANFANTVEGGAQALGVQMVDGLGKVQAATTLTAEEMTKLEDAIGDAAEKGASALGSWVDATIAFQDEVATATTEHWAKIAEIDKELGGQITDARRAELETQRANLTSTFAQQEQDRAVAYATEAANLRAHLGEMLIETVNSWVLMGKVPVERAQEMNAALATEYGVQLNNSQLMFGQLVGHMMGWRDNAGIATSDVIADMQATGSEAVETERKARTLTGDYVMNLIENMPEGSAHADELTDALGRVPREINIQINSNAASVAAAVDSANSALDRLKARSNQTVRIHAEIDGPIETHSPSPMETSLQHISEIIQGMPVLRLQATGIEEFERAMQATASLTGGYAAAPTPMSGGEIGPFRRLADDWKAGLQDIITGLTGANRDIQRPADDIQSRLDRLADGAENLAERLRMPTLDIQGRLDGLASDTSSLADRLQVPVGSIQAQLDGLAGGTESLADRLSVPTDAIRSHLQTAVDAIAGSADAIGLTAPTMWEPLTGTLSTVPGVIESQGGAIVAKMNAMVDAYNAAIARIKTPEFIGSYDRGDTWNPGTPKTPEFSFRALGGPVTAGMPYIVGERGREAFVPRQSGYIVPNNQLGRGGDTYNFGDITIGNGMSPEEVKRALKEAVQATKGGLRAELRSEGLSI